MASEVNVQLKLQPKQTELLNLCDNSIASTIGYGGSRGGGKSGALRRIMLLRRLNNPGTTGLIFRRVYDDLKRNHIDKFFEEFPALFKFYRSTDHEVVLPAVGDLPPSRIVFGYAETETEIKRKFHGVEYMDMFVDQAEQLSEQEMKIMKTACRWPGVGRYACKFVLFFNPGGVGITYLKRIFSQKQYRDKERPSDYQFIQAFGWDNVEWARSALIDDGLTEEDFYSWDNDKRFDYFVNETQYGQELDALPQALRIGYLMGSFDKFAGQYFDVWDEERQTKKLDELNIQPWHPKWISIDWGYNHDSAVYWWAQDGEVTKTYRERVISGYGPRALAQDIIDRTNMFDGEELGEIDAIYISPDTRANREGRDTIADQLGKVFTSVGMPRPRIADDHRVSGFMLMHEMLHYNRWIIGKNCPKLIENIPMFSRDEKNPEDCFVAGTLINTNRGLVPIEKLTKDDFILTREGFKPMVWVDRIGDRQVYTLKIDGKQLTGTAEHPIWTDNRGWVPLIKLCVNDIIPSWTLSSLTALSFIGVKEENTSVIIWPIDLKALRIFTERSGNFITVLFRKVMRYTIRLGTKIQSIISSVFLSPNTDLCTPEGLSLGNLTPRLVLNGLPRPGNQINPIEASYVKDAENFLKLDVEKKLSGVLHPVTGNGTENKLKNRFVNTVVKSFKVGWPSTVNKKSQGDSVLKGVLTLEPAGLQTVYNLQVRSCHEFFANGILTHNCVKFLGDDPGDSARYGLKSRFSSREIPHDIQLTAVLESVKNKTLLRNDNMGSVHTAMHLSHLRFQENWKKTHSPVRRIRSWRPSA